jgi:hypothetical protein
MVWAGLLTEELQTSDEDDPDQTTMKAELGSLQKSVDEIAAQLIEGLEAVVKMESPYPPEYQEMVYKAVRFSIGSGFDQMLTESELDELIQRLKKNGTL